MLRELGTVLAKELKTIVRDKKTFIFSVILPLILVPGILFLVDLSLKNTKNKITENINISINEKSNLFYEFCNSQNNITIIDKDKNSLKTGEISAYIFVDESLNEKILKGENFNLEIEYNKSSLNSMMVSPILTSYENAFKDLCTKIKEYIDEGNELDYVGAKEYIDSFKMPDKNFDVIEQDDLSNVYFNMLVPMMLIIYCCIGSAGYAVEMTAGEKERNTLEPLLSTGANRSALAIGKLIATTITGVISSLSTAFGLCFYKFTNTGNAMIFEVKEMFMLLLVVLICSVFFAALNLAIGIYSKSFKEAQIYMTPLTMISLVPAYFTYFTNVLDTPIYYFSIPILNIVCVIKELLVGVINIYHIGITFGWFIFYVFVVFLFIINMFNRERVIFRM